MCDGLPDTTVCVCDDAASLTHGDQFARCWSSEALEEVQVRDRSRGEVTGVASAGLLNYVAL